MPRAIKPSVSPVPIENRIHTIRNRKVMLDADLAALYGVTTSALNQAARRNPERFPNDFMFALTQREAGRLLSQTVIAKIGRGGRRTTPNAFTEHGVAMLSSVLKGDRAIQVNLIIVRTFVRMRELVAANKDIATRVERLETSHKGAASVIEALVGDIDRLTVNVQRMKALPVPRKPKIGFTP